MWESVWFCVRHSDCKLFPGAKMLDKAVLPKATTQNTWMKALWCWDPFPLTFPPAVQKCSIRCLQSNHKPQWETPICHFWCTGKTNMLYCALLFLLRCLHVFSIKRASSYQLPQRNEWEEVAESELLIHSRQRHGRQKENANKRGVIITTHHILFYNLNIAHKQHSKSLSQDGNLYF